jgi:hypothetical protein
LNTDRRWKFETPSTTAKSGILFAPDGIENFDDAWNRRVDVEGFPVCNIDDIVSSNQAANRRKDKETLPRLLSFRDWLRSSGEFVHLADSRLLNPAGSQTRGNLLP